uniref:Glucose/Sorbosone dehydrogenase domain-containing protein n=1 Tax=Chaetoceros debilis TaxID=122233 RepID=A0A7S3V8H0_9STRA
MNTSQLPAGVTLDWNLGSAGQTYKVKSMTETHSLNEVILVMTSSTLPVGWDKADAELPAKGAYSQWVCGPEEFFWMRDIFRPGVLPVCSDVGAGQESFTGYDVFVTYAINDEGNLNNPRPFFVAENYVGPGHLGGGIATLGNGDILYSVGDCSHFGIDGTYPPQINSEHCGKIMRIKNSETERKYKIVAKGVRNPQQMRIFRRRGQSLLGFMDIGGATAEEVNAYPLRKIQRTEQIENFGWGRNQEDGKAREGTFYVGPGNGLKLGSDEPPCEESAPIGEAGFIQPWIQFGRTPTDFFYAISSFAVPTKGLDELKLIWSEFNTGMLLGTKQNPKFDGKYKGPARSFKIRLYDTSLNELKNGLNDLVQEELGEVGYYRGDPRLFHYPDGSAGVFIERTGVFYKLTEIML